MVVLVVVMFLGNSGCSEGQQIIEKLNMTEMKQSEKQTLELATFGAGCFWCVEAMFESLKGVESAVSGYSGGKVKRPTYKEVCNGNTGHAEVIQVHYNPAVISYEELLEAFFLAHDATTLNRQGADVGTQYRSVIFFHTALQQQLAKEYKSKLDASKAFSSPIVTEITAFETFYEAEDYHQEYFTLNPDQPYCSRVVGPKLDKFRKVFKEKLK
jgi:peptide-methionine (S)-S-oxide reductase